MHRAEGGWLAMYGTSGITYFLNMRPALAGSMYGTERAGAAVRSGGEERLGDLRRSRVVDKPSVTAAE
jgi:hypothetical protein